MFPASSRFVRRPILSFLPVRSAAAGVLLLALAGGSSSLRAATAAEESGARLLTAELPSGTKLSEVGCEVLARAVGKATKAHRAEAPEILSAALNGGVEKGARHSPEHLPCSCVSRIVRASLTAAPSEASAVFDQAVAIYPDCADELAALLDLATKAGYNYKDAVNPIDPGDQPVAGINNVGGVIGTGLSGFGAGLGPGFPGSPGFSGSDPSTGLALPPAGGVPAVTQTTNL